MDVKEAEVKDYSWDEADQKDVEMSQYFKPEVNILYTLTFSGWRLVQKQIPDFKDKTKFNERIVLNLLVDSINGKATTPKEWGILPIKLRNLFRIPCTNGNLSKKKYQFKVSGEGTNKQYVLSELGDR